MVGDADGRGGAVDGDPFVFLGVAQLIGNGPEVLRGIDAVGNDFDTWTGMCGKNGQSVPVSSGWAVYPSGKYAVPDPSAPSA